MSDLVGRLRTDHFFSDSVMAARMEEDEMTIDIMRSERKEAAARIEQLEAALNYVADMTYCGADAEWHFKPGYDPQEVLDALGQSSPPARQENDDVFPGFRGNNEA